jgi:hypothetical protein
MPAINTGKVSDRRSLRFATIDDLLLDIDRIVAAAQKGTLRHSGNWTAGQAFAHLAAWINYAYEGYPPGAHPPWFIRWILKRKKREYLNQGMPAGVRIPRAENGTFGTEPASLTDGADRLQSALLRLKNREPARFDSPAFGQMPHDERVAFNLRHAELHLSFQHPD